VDRPFEALRQDLVQGLKRTQMVRTDAARGKSGEESH
jgi:hypothetical protein